MEVIYKYTIQLIRYILTGVKPELVEDIDFEALYSFSESHGVENMVYTALMDLGIKAPKETMDKFEEANDIAIANEAMQALELETISERFEEEGIDHLPLKGSVVKYLYPDPSYRQSGDVDILIRKNDEDKTDSIMFGFEYQRDPHFEKYEVHYAYKKAPSMEVEIHRQLVKKTNRAYRFMKTVWEHTRLQEGAAHKYYMENEFMYTYMLAHLCNHLYMGGAGIRMFTDFYVMRKEISFDEEIINKYLKKANLTDINKLVLKLIDSWFSTENVIKDNTIISLEKIIFCGGSFGTKEQSLYLRANDSLKGRLHTLFRKIFPSKYNIKYRHKELSDKNIPWLFLWFGSAYYMIKYKRNKIKDGFTEAAGVKKKEDLSEIAKAVKDR